MTTATRSVLLTVVTVAALTVAYLLGAGGRDDARAAVSLPAVSATDLGTITMTGTGEVSAVPDQLTFRVAVTNKADDAATAMKGASRTMRRVLGALEDAGVERRDIESTGLSVDPEYEYFSSAPRQLTGYRVRQSAAVTVRELRHGGGAIAAAVEAGGNAVRVSGVSLRIGDKEALLAEARDTAIDDATGKAEQYAESTGQPLGGVLTVREGRLPGRPTPPRDLRASYAVADVAKLSAVPLRAGRTDLGVKVTVVWRLGG